MWATVSPDQSKSRSESQWSGVAWLLASSLADFCNMLTMPSTPASFAARAKYAVA